LKEYEATRFRPIARFFRQPAVAERVLHRLNAALRVSPLRASIWRQLAVVSRLLGRTDEAQRCSQRAESLEEAAAGRHNEVGRVLADSVYHLVGGAKGLSHAVGATRRPAQPGRGGVLGEILGKLEPEVLQAGR